MRLVWRKRAQDDRKRIARYIAEAGNLQAALKLDAEFQTQAQTTVSGMIRHKSGRVPGTHEIVVRPNYVLVYSVTPAQVSILRVLHARQEYP
jgi:addiction module RelE/StbE family toxin